MMRRVLTLLLVIAMLGSMAACGNEDGPVITGPQTEETEPIADSETADTPQLNTLTVTKSREEAYRDLVQEYIRAYGVRQVTPEIEFIMPGYITEPESVNVPSSLIYVGQWDFSGDGNAELVVVWQEATGEDWDFNLKAAVYEYVDEEIQEFLKPCYIQESFTPVWSTAKLIIAEIDQKIVLAQSVDKYYYDLNTTSREQIMEPTEYQIFLNADAQSIPQTENITELYTISEQYTTSTPAGSRTGYSTWLNDTQYQKLLASLQEMGITDFRSTSEYLDHLPYLGDRNLCKMSAEQANAYAEVLESLPNDLDGLMEDTGRHFGKEHQLFAMLADPTDEGIPILITGYLGIDHSWDTDVDQNRNAIAGPTKETELSLWQWDGKTVEQFAASDLYRHPSIPNPSYMSFSYGFTTDGNQVYFELGGGDSMGSYLGTEYRIQNGKIEYSAERLVYGAVPVEHTDGLLQCFAPGDSEGELLPPAPFSVQKHPNPELTYEIWAAPKENIESYGWEPGLRVAYNLYLLNGTIVTSEEFSRQDLFGMSISQSSSGDCSIEGDWRDGKAAAATLREYAELLTGVSYDYPEILETLSATQRELLEKAVEGQVVGTLGGLYDLSNDLYYAVYYDNDTPSGGVLLRQNLHGYRVVEFNDKPVTQAALQASVEEAEATPNISLDYNNAGDDPVGYLKQALEQVDGTTINDAAKQLLASYTEAASADSGSFAMNWTDGMLRLPADTIKDHVSAMETMENTLEEALDGISLNKTLSELVQIYCPKWDPEQPIQLVLDRESMEAAAAADGIQLIFGSGQHSITVETSAWEQLMEQYDPMIVQVQPEAAGYSITYSQEDGTPIDQIPEGITFTLPASTETATVLATYSGGTSDNWGGQYDARNETVEFTTPYSGNYEVMDNAVEIQDLQTVDAETADAIAFMVSKGYFAVDDSGNFHPDDILNRYEFTEALVRMFFALDRNLTTSFTDVPAESPYYAYVASGEQRDIIKGYEDQTFRGENPVLREQIIALCSRTLVDYRGYLYPKALEDYLQFTDADAISDWARDTTALAVRELLVERGGTLNPQGEVTRAEAAQMLYRLFMLLYETPMVDLAAEAADETRLVYEVNQPNHTLPVVLVGGGALLASAGAVWYFKLRKIKKG